MPMIAAIEEDKQVVWGFGRTEAEAMQDARYFIEQKAFFKVGRLRCVPMRENADLDGDGHALYKQCIVEPESQTTQMELLS